MKIVLVQPPVEDFHEAEVQLQPLGLCYLKAAVRAHHPDASVVVRDFHQGYGRKSLPLPPELRYLREYYRFADQGPFCAFQQYYHFGASYEEIAGSVAAEAPDLVGISCQFSPYHREALRCAREIRSLVDVPVVLGGPHVSAAPMSVLKDPAVDFIIRGPGEKPLVELVAALKRGGGFADVAGLGWKRDGRPVLNPLEGSWRLDELPLPDLSDLPPERYLFEGRPVALVAASRGCPHGCSFCSVRRTFPRHQRRPAEAILAEVRQRYDEGYRVFDFEDDNLAFDQAEAKHLCRLLAEAFPEGEAQFLALNGVAHASLDSELLGLMRQAGFTHLNLSLVSTDCRVLETIRRPKASRSFEAVASEAAALGFRTTAFVILGLPGDRLDAMIRSMAVLARLPVLIGASVFYLAPGSPLAGEFPHQTEDEYFLARSSAMAMETEHARRDDLYSLFLTARVANFLKGLPIEAEEADLGEALATADGAGGRAAVGADLLRLFGETGRLCARTSDGAAPLERFRPELLRRFLAEAGHITTLAGHRIKVADAFRAPPGADLLRPYS